MPLYTHVDCNLKCVHSINKPYECRLIYDFIYFLFILKKFRAKSIQCQYCFVLHMNWQLNFGSILYIYLCFVIMAHSFIFWQACLFVWLFYLFNSQLLNEKVISTTINKSYSLTFFFILRYDVGQDGFLDLAELKFMMEKLQAPQTHIGLKAMIAEVDEDKDGKISFREFLLIYR